MKSLTTLIFIFIWFIYALGVIYALRRIFKFQAGYEQGTLNGEIVFIPLEFNDENEKIYEKTSNGRFLIGTYAQWEIDKHMSKREKNKILKKTLEESPCAYLKFF